MKTAMQELIEIIKEHRDNYKGKEVLRVKKAFGDILCAIDDFKLLEKEKQQIIDAVKYGFLDATKPSSSADIYFDEYYNKTFKQE